MIVLILIIFLIGKVVVKAISTFPSEYCEIEEGANKKGERKEKNKEDRKDKKGKKKEKQEEVEEEDIEKNSNGEEKIEQTKIITDEVQVKKEEYKKIFNRDLFLGDSITDSLSFYKLINDYNVIAKLGYTTVKAQVEVDNIVKKNPENIYILFGLNDIGYDVSSQEFADNYAKLIRQIKERLPDTNIYVQSILPVTADVEKRRSRLNNSNIKEFNRALVDMAKKEKINYLNIAFICREKTDVYEPDGIHPQYSFYELWLDYLIKNIKGIDKVK